MCFGTLADFGQPKPNQAWNELPQPQDFTAFGLLNVKPCFFQTVVPVDFGAIEVQSRLFVDDHVDAVAVVLAVRFVVETVVKIQRVAKSAAATAGDADTEQHRVVKNCVLFGTAELLPRLARST